MPLRRAQRPPWAKSPSVANAAGVASKGVTGNAARARTAYVEVVKTDKAGREYVARDDVIVSNGMFTAREAQRLVDKAAAKSDQRVIGTVVEPYDGRDVPGTHHGSSLSEQGQKGDAWGGFRGSGAFPPESPRIRAINARREEPASAEPETD